MDAPLTFLLPLYQAVALRADLPPGKPPRTRSQPWLLLADHALIVRASTGGCVRAITRLNLGFVGRL